MQGEHLFNCDNLSSITRISDIKALDKLLLKQASEIYDISLGQKYIPFQDLLRYAANPDLFVLLGTTIDQTLLGIMLAYPLENETVNEYTHVFKEYNLPILFSDFKVGLIKSVAVRPAYRHQGIGTKLTIESMIRLKEMSCDSFLAVSWVSNRPDSSQKMFEKLGFKNILSIPDYWTEDSIKEGYLCPNCGNPCHCTAIFYLYTPSPQGRV
ncbi:MAG: N-acetyltransferase [bacterium]|nr:N-acetyltransferase [bacterium]